MDMLLPFARVRVLLVRKKFSLNLLSKLDESKKKISVSIYDHISLLLYTFHKPYYLP